MGSSSPFPQQVPGLEEMPQSLHKRLIGIDQQVIDTAPL